MGKYKSVRDQYKDHLRHCRKHRLHAIGQNLVLIVLSIIVLVNTGFIVYKCFIQ